MLVRQPKTAVFFFEIEVQIYHRPALKVLKSLFQDTFLCIVSSNTATRIQLNFALMHHA